jgi:hypothetical protein
MLFCLVGLLGKGFLYNFQFPDVVDMPLEVWQAGGIYKRGCCTFALLEVLVLFLYSRLYIVSRYRKFLLGTFYYFPAGDTVEDVPDGNTPGLVIGGSKK